MVNTYDELSVYTQGAPSQLHKSLQSQRWATGDISSIISARICLVSLLYGNITEIILITNTKLNLELRDEKNF